MNYHNCVSPYQRVVILEKIANLQRYLSAYYDATREVMKESYYMKKYYVPELEADRYDKNMLNSSGMQSR